MVGAIGAAVAFLRRNLLEAAALFAFDFALFWGVRSALTSASDMATASGVADWVRMTWFAVTIVAWLWLKLLFWATETALFQARLAHAGYVARPEPVWPDSPVAEAISGGGA
jgi:hypothetical protein